MSCESSSDMQQPQLVVSYIGDPYEALPWNIPITVLIHLSVSLVLCREKGRVFVLRGLGCFMIRVVGIKLDLPLAFNTQA